MDLVAVLTTIVVGGLIGWVASIVMKTNAQMGLLGNIVVGIVGAFCGRFLAGAIGIEPTNLIGGLLVALGGAMVLIVVLRFFKILK